MKVTPEGIQRARRVLRVVQIVLFILLIVALWMNDEIALWQRLVAIAAGAWLLYSQLRRDNSRPTQPQPSQEPTKKD